MEKGSTDTFLQPLEQLQHVEVPPFLFTRIQQAIETHGRDLIPGSKAALVGFAFCLLLVFNFFILMRSENPQRKPGTALSNFDLFPDNNIYK